MPPKLSTSKHRPHLDRDARYTARLIHVRKMLPISKVPVHHFTLACRLIETDDLVVSENFVQCLVHNLGTVGALGHGRTRRRVSPQNSASNCLPFEATRNNSLDVGSSKEMLCGIGGSCAPSHPSRNYYGLLRAGAGGHASGLAVPMHYEPVHQQSWVVPVKPSKPT